MILIKIISILKITFKTLTVIKLLLTIINQITELLLKIKNKIKKIIFNINNLNPKINKK